MASIIITALIVYIFSVCFILKYHNKYEEKIEIERQERKKILSSLSRKERIKYYISEGFLDCISSIAIMLFD